MSHNTLGRFSGLSRRAFVAVAASAAFIPSPLMAQARVRPEARSTAGHAMLKVYRDGVAAMKKLPPYDPRSWLFQANMHSIHPEHRNRQAIDRIFDPGQGNTPEERAKIREYRLMALTADFRPRLWESCKHSSDTEVALHFLSWHRIFLHYFERIVANQAQADFALPFWDYTRTDLADARVLPIEFRQSIGDSFPANALWHQFRDTDKNNPTAPTPLDPQDVSTTDAFAEGSTLPTNSDQGFSQVLENTPHGLVHVAVGIPAQFSPTGQLTNDPGMAIVPTAARDAIFWLHHANLDRLWERWRGEHPGTDPGGDWLTEKFEFADETGTLVTKTAADALNLNGLGYGYEYLVPPTVVAGNTAGARAAVVAQASGVVQQTTAPSGTTVGPGGARLKLQPAQASPAAGPRAAVAGGRYDLVVSGITGTNDPGTPYEVFLIDSDRSGRETLRLPVGRFSVFGLANARMPIVEGVTSHAQHGNAPGALTRTFDITALVLANPRVATDDVTVEIRPVKTDANTPITVGSVRVVKR